MRFSITAATENSLHTLSLKDHQTGTMASILPAYGALLHTFGIVRDGQFFNIIDNYKSAEQLQKELATSFKSSKLSPFACRIPGGKYTFDAVDYEFHTKFMDGSAIHGLLYNKPFSIITESAGEDNAMVILQYDYDNEDKGYPFHYRCEVEYTLDADNKLHIQTKIINLSYTTLPIADGWHPYFQLGGKVDDWIMNFPAASIVEFDTKLIPTGALKEYQEFEKPRALGNIELDNCFLLKKDYEGPACRLVNPGNGLALSLFPDAGYPYLQIYIPPERNSMAIENLSAAPNAFNNKMGLMLLLPGDSQTFTVLYALSTV